MEMIIAKQDTPLFYAEPEAFSGVEKIAAKVRADLEAVTGHAPGATDSLSALGPVAVIYGTLGRSPALDSLTERKLIDPSRIAGGRERYLFTLVAKPFPGVETALVIAGSDKRGTVYGLFHLSELAGVSPLVNWSGAVPVRKERIVLTDKDSLVSREPSVRFRGFFINDEWPALGTWATKRFGGLNAKMYDAVFELLLRLKGNYLWPAMWASVFSDDGPGLENAILADEYGVIMGMSHHEPCLRHGEEYKRLRGKGSPYGDAWNFRSNPEGITKFWEDGLARSGRFENVITVGMRGEADSAIMGKEATMADNVQLLRDVLKTQKKLIADIVKPVRGDTPMMLALYKEVEAYFYGDEKTPGLIGSKDLEDVILMFSDDNFGNLRTLPTAEMRGHPGGYGIYYHFDYHGWPVSFEWVNSTYLPKVWEQMTQAWEFGVRDLWIVNVGDICTNEFPLSYFLDLAYDFDAWGSSAPGSTVAYTERWVASQFGAWLTPSQKERVSRLLTDYAKIAHMRRSESMNAEVYHPFNYREADRMLERVGKVLEEAASLKAEMPAEILPPFFQQVYFPAVANMYAQKTQLLAGKNLAYAREGRVEANLLAERVGECLADDERLVEEFHGLAGGRWYGMGLSEHIGFRNWNEEECAFPLQVTFKSANKPRIVVSVPGCAIHTQGGDWTRKELVLADLRRPDRLEAFIEISNGGSVPAKYEITTSEGIRLSSTSGTVAVSDRIAVSVNPGSRAEGEILIVSAASKVRVRVPAPVAAGKLEPNVYLETSGYVAMEAERFFARHDTASGAFAILPGHGKALSAAKAYPSTGFFTPGADAPSLEYRFVAQAGGAYAATLYLSPSNPVDKTHGISFAIQTNGGPIAFHDTVPAGAGVGDDQAFWAQGVLANNRVHACLVQCVAGPNSLRVYAVTPGFVLERLVLHPEASPIPPSCLGPEESYHG